MIICNSELREDMRDTVHSYISNTPGNWLEKVSKSLSLSTSDRVSTFFIEKQS